MISLFAFVVLGKANYCPGKAALQVAWKSEKPGAAKRPPGLEALRFAAESRS